MLKTIQRALIAHTILSLLSCFNPFPERFMNSISDKYHPGYPEWHLRDSGLSLCEAFSLPPRAIIDDEANRHSAGAEAVFLLRLRLRKLAFDAKTKQKNRTTFGCAICFSFVIRLGFEPKTHSLEGCCSIQLSYRTILILRNEAARMKADCKYT